MKLGKISLHTYRLKEWKDNFKIKKVDSYIVLFCFFKKTQINKRKISREQEGISLWFLSFFCLSLIGGFYSLFS